MRLNIYSSLRAMHAVVLCCTALLANTSNADSIHQPTIAIIIDDIGHHYQNGIDLINLPYPLTLSMLPGRKYTQTLAELATLSNKEVMLHAPMENTKGLDLGHGALTSQMSEHQIKHTLRACLDAIPNVAGINNHMGSLLTTQPAVMRWVMESLQQTSLYFVDSRTSAKSIAAKIANAHAIPTATRDVFLDHQQNRNFVRQQFKKLLSKARSKGTAIAIAHPHRVTIDYLSWALPKLGERGYRIASVSGLMAIRQAETIQKQSKSRLAKLEHKQESENHSRSIASQL